LQKYSHTLNKHYFACYTIGGSETIIWSVLIILSYHTN